MKLIVLYKFAKAVAELLFAFILFRLISGGETEPLLLAAKFSRRHVVSMVSLSAAEWLFRVKPLTLYYTDLALGLDGVITFIEGVSLNEGYPWAPLFVVFVSGLPLPLEIIEIIRSPRTGRIIFFLANILIVMYAGRLASRSWAASRRGRAKTLRD